MRVQDIKYGPVYRFKDSTFYAAAGSIVFHDNRKEDHCSFLSVSTFKERARALNEQLDALGPQFSPGAVEHRRDLKRLVHDMDLCIKDATLQGDPLDPKVQAWFRKHKPWKGRQSSLAGVAALQRDPVSYEATMPKLPRGEFTGKTDVPAGLILPEFSGIRR